MKVETISHPSTSSMVCNVFKFVSLNLKKKKEKMKKPKNSLIYLRIYELWRVMVENILPKIDNYGRKTGG